MGLDMYLNAKRYIPEYNDEGKELSGKIANIVDDIPEDCSVREISIRVGYWRKFNALHAWFVKNVQNDNDNCEPYYVSFEECSQIRDICEEILCNPEKAPELMPSQSGFFFGSTDYDEWYKHHLENTILIMNKALELDPSKWELEYQASW